METTKYRILIADDDAGIRDVIVTVLSAQGHICDEAADGAQALAKTAEKQYDAVITDINMPEMNGIDLARVLLKSVPSRPVMIMTGLADEQSTHSIIPFEVQVLIHKPFTLDEITMKFAMMMNGRDNEC